MKLKTHQFTAKRVKISGGKKKKLMMKKAGQDHFNARESGNVTRSKRRDIPVKHVDERNIRNLLPYS